MTQRAGHAAERGDRGGRNQILHRQLRTEYLPQARDEPHRAQRIAAAGVEVIVETDIVEAENRGNFAGQRDLQRRFRLPARDGFVIAGECSRIGQRFAIELPRRRARDRGYEGDGGWDARCGETGCKKRLDLARIQRRGPANDIGCQLLTGGARSPRNDYRFRNQRMIGEGRFDRPEFDAHAADLHLRVDAAEKIDRAIVAPTREIAAAVHRCARLRRERIGNESFGREIGPPEIAQSDAGAAGVDFTGHADRNRPQLCVEDVDRCVRDRRPERNG